MLPPKIVLLIGNRGESVQAIQQSLSSKYQVVHFQSVEKEVSWFNPIAVILHQNGGPAEELTLQLRRLKQIKPQAPVLLCRSGKDIPHHKDIPKGINASLAWPGDSSRIRALLQSWEHRRLGWLGRLRLGWQAFRNLFSSADTDKGPALLPEILATKKAEGIRMEAHLLGAFVLKEEGRRLPPIRSEINRAMLAYLLFHGPERMPRHKIIEGFWPDSGEEAARNCLNVAISSVRKYWRENSGQPMEVSFRENAYYFQAPAPFFSDVSAFLKYWDRGKALERAGRLDEALNAYRQACHLYSGDFLECINRNIDWVESMRSKLKEAYLSVLDRLSVLFFDRGLYPESEEACHRILEIDDCIESAHRQLMRIYYSTNRRGRALRQYAHCCRSLREKLGVEPFGETEELYQRVANGRL
ncbi:MAG: hypothetical protein H6560_27625 [Lewinellaceae bacterium]|nr:hypothetical protein [Lewinellaceae bacterium]